MHVRTGVAIEFGTHQYAEPGSASHIDFIEYGLQIWRGVPEWLFEMRDRYRVPLHLHPLDVNLAGGVDDAWCEELARLVKITAATALVSDAGFWYLGSREATWPRPPTLPLSARRCRETAAQIARITGVPFRIENPPVEWMAKQPSIWKFLDQATDADGVEICLDVSHLCQFQFNVHRNQPTVPKQFPWQKVSEIHLAGYITVEYGGQRRRLDQHLAEIDDEQLKFAVSVLQRLDHDLDVCFEMEPRSLADFERNAAKFLSLSDGIARRCPALN